MLALALRFDHRPVSGEVRQGPHADGNDFLKEHKTARAALKITDWNRLTIIANGNVVKTWVNGVPAANWADDGTYAKGAFGLQIHKGKKGTVLWRDLRVKELKP